MKTLHILSAAEQVAGHLREQMARGGLAGEMPGVRNLASALGANHKTVEAALHLLERQRFLRPQGAGRRRKIVLPKNLVPPALRVQVLPYEPSDLRVHFMIEVRHSLSEAGHSAEFAPKSLLELKMDPKRVARLVKRTPADAWVVQSASREVLGWFADQPFPSFALFGRLSNMPLAGAGKLTGPAIGRAVRRLAALGHRRIVLLMREEHRKPHPGPPARLFLQELEDLGITPGPYNLPDWENSPKGFQQCLVSLFRYTPPTALIIDETTRYFVVRHFLAQRRIVSPEDVSLVCLDPDPSFAWCEPVVSHINYDSRPWVQRVVRWADNVARGKDDRRQIFTKAEFVEGGTIGPAPRRK